MSTRHSGGDYIAPKIGCTPETLREWVRGRERDSFMRRKGGYDIQEDKATRYSS